MSAMKTDEKYSAPQIDVIEIYAEGVLCESGTESLTEKDGIW